MSVLDPIFRSYDEGRAALLLTGRSLHDLVDAEDGKVRPLIEALRRGFRSRYGMALITYSLAGGLDWDASGITDERDRRTIEQALRAHSLVGIPPDQNEVVRVIRGISSMCRTPSAGLTWADGQALKFAFLLLFADHLVPAAAAHAGQPEILVAAELAYITAQSLALRSSGNMVLFHARESMVDQLVSTALHRVRLTQPGREEKARFLAAATGVYTGARFEEGLTKESVALLTANTPNRGLEMLLRASDRTKRPITAQELVAQKSCDVEDLSEQTLTALDPRRAQGVELVGAHIAVPAAVVNRCAEGLLHGDSSVPANLLLAGPPGAGKTDLSIGAAWRAKAAAYQMHSPKAGIVGETERRARLQQTVLAEWAPAVVTVDEITETFPLERSSHNGDSGASKAVMGALLTALSDETRRGRSLLIATTNVPWSMSEAMRSRFEVIPVLHPLKRDYAAIAVSIAQRVLPGTTLEAAAAEIVAAGDLFYEKGASPRHIRAALSRAVLRHKSLTPAAILFAAEDLCEATGLTSIIYADLWALWLCSSRSYLPWTNDRSYEFPEHIQGLVLADGKLDRDSLEKRIERLRPHANV